MSRIFITGSADGLGQLAAKALVAQGHSVVLHARDEKRGQDALAKVPGAENVVTADLSNIADTIKLAEKVNTLGKFDAIIHNAGVYTAPPEAIFTINTLAPYILTCLIEKPKRLIYISSDLHEGGSAKLDSFLSGANRITYSDSKFHVLMLCKTVARMWPDVYSNAVHPGWVPTKMGGSGAPDSLEGGYQTQVWLAASDDAEAKVSGRYFFHQKPAMYNTLTDDPQLQDKFIDACGQVTGISFPEI